MKASFIDRLLRIAVAVPYALLKARWRARQPRTFGAHALALTPSGAFVLVRLRYAEGWRLPGGGVGVGEDPEQAVLRELREEIGMTAHGEVRLARQLEERPNRKRDRNCLFIVRDVEYRPRWSWEVERVREARLDALPPDLARVTERWLRDLRPLA